MWLGSVARWTHDGLTLSRRMTSSSADLEPDEGRSQLWGMTVLRTTMSSRMQRGKLVNMFLCRLRNDPDWIWWDTAVKLYSRSTHSSSMCLRRRRRTVNTPVGITTKEEQALDPRRTDAHARPVVMPFCSQTDRPTREIVHLYAAVAAAAAEDALLRCDAPTSVVLRS